MRLRILYDNEAIPEFLSDWGFSCLIELDDRKILFDTGKDGRVLLNNMEKMGIDKEEIEIIVLSHNHWDHIGGLSQVMHPDAAVYLPASFPTKLKSEIAESSHLFEVKDFAEIDRGVHTTGELGTSIIEQSLLVESDAGLILITGCAHPGLENILDVAGGRERICGIVGGFHGFDELEKLSGLGFVCPCHCTSQKKEIHKAYPEASIECAAGRTIEIKR